MLPIDYSGRLTECGVKYLALYRSIRDAIAEGALAFGDRLPSTRQLAETYELSRGSVSLAYEMLAAEGFVRSWVGQGTFVAGTEESRAGNGHHPELQSAEPSLSAWGERVMRHRQDDRMAAAGSERTEKGVPVRISFVPMGVGGKWFPWDEWRTVAAARWKKLANEQTRERPRTEGSTELRQAIANRLGRERGIRCTPDDIIVTSGSMQAIALICQLLIEEGSSAVAENPGYPGIRRAIRATGAALQTAKIDDQGIVPAEWEAKLLFVTPARQFPTGAVLAYERRLALLSWASRRGAWIVEDDYDSDFRWGGRPIEPLKALDREQRVVYIGSFSRSMRTEVRVGYAVVPPKLREPLLAAKELYDTYPAAIVEQRALADWMSSGGFDRYMRRLRRTFGRLEGLLRHRLETRLADWFWVAPSDSGLHLYAIWRKSPALYTVFAEECRKQGVAWKDGTGYDADSGSSPSGRRHSALFGFSHLDEQEIEEGIAVMARVAESIREG